MTKLSRRDVLKASASFGAGLYLGTTAVRAAESPNEKLDIACIGVGGRGSANVGGVKSQNIVAMCDVDATRAGKAFANTKAAKFTDYRRMFDKMENQLDAVVISTPDHTHFHPAMIAIRSGKHVYCEKPLAHNVWEVRQLTVGAREAGVATQLGAQRHAMPNMARVVESIQAGTIGEVTEVHSWISSKRGMPSKPTEFPSVPSDLDWDLWLGPAHDRKYSRAYCPYNWRFWWDFGTGETGNWGCHILDIPYWALGLKYPTRVEASGPEVDDERTPTQMATKFEFPATGGRSAVTLYWYQQTGGPTEVIKKYNIDKPGNTIFIGTKGILATDFSKHNYYPLDGSAEFTPPSPSIPKSPGFHQEWINACRGGEPATCNFDYSGPMAETVLLGNVAYRAGGFQWDAENLKCEGNDQAQELIREEYRAGWEI